MPHLTSFSFSTAACLPKLNMDPKVYSGAKHVSFARLTILAAPLAAIVFVVGSVAFGSNFLTRRGANGIDAYRLPFPTHRPANMRFSRHKPTIMLGVMMEDTPAATLQRNILRMMFPPEDVSLHFPICRPTAETMLETDVVPIDMEENINIGKTQRWFWYAQKYRPKSVTAVFKMDTDVMFCLPDLLKTISTHESPYEYFGTFMNHISCWKHDHCPPIKCQNKNKFEGDCWYYMSGGLYGISTQLLDKLPSVASFAEPQSQVQHEDISVGHWLNQSEVRTSITERPFSFYHSKDLVRITPPSYSNYISAYMTALMSRRCAIQVKRIAEHFSQMYTNKP
jgi:hypothetical protein